MHTAEKCRSLAICIVSSMTVSSSKHQVPYGTGQEGLIIIIITSLFTETESSALCSAFSFQACHHGPHLSHYTTSPSQSPLFKFPLHHFHGFFTHGWTSSSSPNLQQRLYFAPSERPSSATWLPVNLILYIHIYMYILMVSTLPSSFAACVLRKGCACKQGLASNYGL